jgi:hypothetical protein
LFFLGRFGKRQKNLARGACYQETIHLVCRLEHCNNSFALSRDHIRSGNIADTRCGCRNERVIVTGSYVPTGETESALPVTFSYTYGAKTFQVVVNGYTGSIAGRHPLSWIKISLAALVALVLVIIGLSIYAHSI